MRLQVDIKPHSRRMNCRFVTSSGVTGSPAGLAAKVVALHVFTLELHIGNAAERVDGALAEMCSTTTPSRSAQSHSSEMQKEADP
ncbi:hypothetical protein [Streptomyces sp. TE5632]